MKLVQNDRIHASKIWIGHQPPCQDTFGHISQTSTRTTHPFKPHLIPDSLSHGFTHFKCHTACRQTSCDPPWLEHDYLPLKLLKQSWRNTRRLARARRSFDHQIRIVPEGPDHIWQDQVNGERGFALHESHRNTAFDLGQTRTVWYRDVLAKLAVTTGLRRSELFALKWKDMD